MTVYRTWQNFYNNYQGHNLKCNIFIEIKKSLQFCSQLEMYLYAENTTGVRAWAV